MKTNRIVKGSIVLMITFLFMIMSISTAEFKATTVKDGKVQLVETEYSGLDYIEGIDIYPLKDTSVGVNAGFIGGTVDLPFDVTSYNNLEAMNLIVANQAAWRRFSQRRFWDVADGASLMLVFRGIDTTDSLNQGNAIAAMIETAYNFSLNLVFGEWEAGNEVSILVYQGRVIESVFDSFIDDFTGYVIDDGFGEGITSSVLGDAPIKAMGVSLVKGRHLNMLPILGLVPVLECAWIDPEGLDKTDTVIDMSLLNIMPDLSEVSGATDAKASIISMDLPYVVDVLEIDPDTDNMYPHLKGKFEWVVKVDIPIWQRDLTHDDIFVSYDLNLSDLRSYPQVIGELSLNSSLPLDGTQDIEYVFTWENVGTETAYNVTLSYGEFSYDELDGFELIVDNPDLTYDEFKIMYYNTSDGYLSDTLLTGSEIYSIQGWFYNDTASSWLGAGEYHPGADFEYLFNLTQVEKSFLNLDIGDFEKTNLTEVADTFTLTTTIDEIAPGENVTKSFAVRDLPTGTVNIYNWSGNQPTSNATLYIVDTPDWEEYFTILLRMSGSSLHIPEDQVTYNNWFPREVVGSAFVYTESDGTEYMGLTNGLVVQIYDDEAILVGKVSLDKDVYRFGENVTFTLELENIGNADATNIDYQFYHAFVTDDLELGYIQQIRGSEGVIPIIASGETVSVNYTETAITNIGLHPVFAMFGYTSNETDDPRDIPEALPWYFTEGLTQVQIDVIGNLTYATEIFGANNHSAVLSSMDFGLVLPPPAKEGTTKPTYPTPEVEVTTELIGLTNDTTVGDELILRTTITNVGDEATNIIYLQRIPDSLGFIPDTDSVTVEGVEVSYDKAWINPPYFGMSIGVIAGDLAPQEAIGVPLGINETMVVEVSVRINNAGEIFIPPAEIRYNSAYNMTARNGINDESGAPTNETQAAILSNLYATSKSAGITVDLSINVEDVTTDRVSTNSWGSYSDSLTIVIETLGGYSGAFIYIGIGLIAVTGVAVIIYFTANGKKH